MTPFKLHGLVPWQTLPRHPCSPVPVPCPCPLLVPQALVPDPEEAAAALDQAAASARAETVAETAAEMDRLRRHTAACQLETAMVRRGGGWGHARDGGKCGKSVYRGVYWV